MLNITILNGPNLNLLGSREPTLYGNLSLVELNRWLQERYQNFCSLTFLQSNSESALIDAIHRLKEKNSDALIFNAAAFTHTSVALRDALLAVNIPFIEVHLSNVHKRESFRHKSFLSDIAVGVVSGLGKYSYAVAVEYFLDFFAQAQQEKNFHV